MHAEYLRRLFLHNDLAEGRYPVGSRPVSLADLRVPVFVVGTVTDHVAPWRSVYKIHLLTDTDLTFVLTSGGHNAGIVSEPGHPHRTYQLARRRPGDKYLDPEIWQTTAPSREGSWWPAWEAWLTEHSGALVAPTPLGSPERGYPALGDAPGAYVLQE
jgi:polyhydroxyalkanoate synthase